MNGKVYITGAGPGDKGLITVKAAEALRIADVVFYDYLVNIELLDYCKDACESIYVGKKHKKHTCPQEDINQMIVDYAKMGKTVVRLKGGDPYVFGRGSEEAIKLLENGIEFEEIPGITSGIAAPAYAGIPVTARNVSSSVAFFTGHPPVSRERDLQWDKISTGIDTLVFYMGVTNAPTIVNNLMEHGRSKETPVALIRWGTCPEQEVVKGELHNIITKMEELDFRPPAIMVVGEVVSISDKLMAVAEEAQMAY